MTTLTATDRARLALWTSVKWGGISSVTIAVIGAAWGFAVAGEFGALSAAVGSVVGFVFTGMTALSILVGLKLGRGTIVSGMFFGIVMGGLVLKMVLFILVAVAIRDTEFVDTQISFIAVIASVVAALVCDVVAVARARVPVVDVLG